MILFVGGCCLQSVVSTVGFLYDEENPRIKSINESEELPTPDWWGQSGSGDTTSTTATLGTVSSIGGDYGADYCSRKGTLDPENPFRGWPSGEPGWITGHFCMDDYIGDWEHEGTDFGYVGGTRLYATAQVFVGKIAYHENAGNFVDMCRPPGWCIRYMHLDVVNPDLSVGDAIGPKGESNGIWVGTVGNTGFSTGVHLHYDIRHEEQFHDPYCTLEPGLCP